MDKSITCGYWCRSETAVWPWAACGTTHRARGTCPAAPAQHVARSPLRNRRGRRQTHLEAGLRARRLQLGSSHPERCQQLIRRPLASGHFQVPVRELGGGGRGIRTPGDFRLNGFQDCEIARPYPQKPLVSRPHVSFGPSNPSQLRPNDGQNDGQAHRWNVPGQELLNAETQVDSAWLRYWGVVDALWHQISAPGGGLTAAPSPQ